MIISFNRRRAPASTNRVRGRIPGTTEAPILHGTLQVKFRELSKTYTTDELSDFHKLRWVTKRAYGNYIRRLDIDLGDRDLQTLTIRDIKVAHALWSADGKIPMGHGLITMLRIVLGFGAGILEDADCQRIRGGLQSVKFPNGKSRKSFLTEEQVFAICERATLYNAISISIAQKLQWWCAFRQKDIIGEWVPVDADPRPSSIVIGGFKWVGGITADEINDDRVITHKTSKRGAVISIPLANCPLTAAEWKALPKSGPLIINPATGRPFRTWAYTRSWRVFADLAGVPESVANMDTRPGRCTWLLASGANPDDVRKYMTHKQLTTTMIYSRDDDGATNRITKRDREAA